MEINGFRGGLTDISAKKDPLTLSYGRQPQVQKICNDRVQQTLRFTADVQNASKGSFHVQGELSQRL